MTPALHEHATALAGAPTGDALADRSRAPTPLGRTPVVMPPSIAGEDGLDVRAAAAASGLRTEELASRALRELVRRQISPTPEHYRLFYLYVSGGAPMLNGDLDRHAGPGGEVSPDQLASLLRRYVGDGADGAPLHDVSAKIGSHLGCIEADLAAFRRGMRSLDEGMASSAAAGHLDDVPDADTGDGLDTRSVKSAVRDVQRLVDGLLESRHRQAEEIRVLQGRLEEARSASEIDGPTGVFNRRAFDTYLLESVGRCQKERCRTALVLVDIDSFKQVNDRLGHLVGDRIIKLVAERLTAHAPEGARVFRYGGDEFAVLLPRVGIGEGRVFADGVRRELERARLTRRADRCVFDLTASFGVAELLRGESATSLFLRADAALYEAKSAGRNRVHVSARRAEGGP